jgi:hypothetical protein
MQMVSFVFTNQYLKTNLIDQLVYVQIFCLVGKDVSTSPPPPPTGDIKVH